MILLKTLIAAPVLNPIKSIMSHLRNAKKANPSISFSMKTVPSVEQFGSCDTNLATSSFVQFNGFLAAASICLQICKCNRVF